MHFGCYSKRSFEAVSRFDESVLAGGDVVIQLLHRKIQLCGYKLLLIALDVHSLHHSDADFQIVNSLYKAWRYIASPPFDYSSQDIGWRFIRDLGAFRVRQTDPFLWRFQDNSLGYDFLLLLTDQEPYGLPFYQLHLLSNLWQLEQGYLPVHAAGIIRNRQCFLFSGPSGAGKSTIADISCARGHRILDEDQVLVHLQENGCYTADAWGYNLEIGQVPLTAFFHLIQDVEDCLMPINPSQVSQLIFARYADVMGNVLSTDSLKQAFDLSIDIAHQVTGYELHFRNSPNFWSLIDKYLLI